MFFILQGRINSLFIVVYKLKSIFGLSKLKFFIFKSLSSFNIVTKYLFTLMCLELK